MQYFHGWASAELQQNRVNVNLFLRHPGPLAVVASPRKSQTKVGTPACFDFLYQNELAM